MAPRARTPRVEKEEGRSWDSDPKDDPTETLQRLVNDQRPIITEGRTGAVAAARSMRA